MDLHMSLTHQESCRTCRKTVKIVLQCSVISGSRVPSVGDHLIIHSHHNIRSVKLHRHMSGLTHCRSGCLVPSRLVASDSVHSCLPVPALRRVISDPRTVVDICPPVHDRKIRTFSVRGAEICKICIDLSCPERFGTVCRIARISCDDRCIRHGLVRVHLDLIVVLGVSLDYADR